MPGFSLFLTLALTCAKAALVPPEEYDRWSAEEKLQWFQKHMDAGNGGSADIAHYWQEGADYCVHPECLYPGGHKTRADIVSRYECRTMALHPTGVVAFVKAVWEPNQYTGMFQKADYGFARWGFQMDSLKTIKQRQSGSAYLANKTLQPLEGNMTWMDADCTIYDCFNVTDGLKYNKSEVDTDALPDKAQFMALKFFRGKVPSAAIHTGPTAPPSHNHLSTTYSNLMMNFGEKANDLTPGSMAEQATQRGTAFPGFTGMHDMAMFDQEGNLEHNLKFPYQIFFIPRPEGAVIPDSPHGYYPETVALAEANGLGPGTPIFDIFVKHSFEAPLEKIGHLELTSKLVMSADTDRQVFFYHPRYDRDLVLRPELKEGYHCTEWWNCALCPQVMSLCNPDQPTLDSWKTWYSAALSDSKTEANKQSKALHRDSLFQPTEQIVPFSCGYAKAMEEADYQDKDEDNGALLQQTVDIQPKRSFLQRKGQPDPQLLQMRDDDIGVEPFSQQLRNLTRWFCEGPAERWPKRPRAAPYASSCEAVLVPGRSVQEPEYALPEDCDDLPPCSKFDGTWYSHTYPCRCGKNVCKTGQLCTSHSNSCISWGPYATQ